MLIVESARRLARDVYVERRLFEILGAWSSDSTDAEAARLFAVLSRHHGEQALWFAALQPVLHDVDDALLAPPDALVDYLAAVAASSSAEARLASLVEVVLPELLAGHEAALATVDECADGPVERVRRRVLLGVQEDWRAATQVLHGGRWSGDGEGDSTAHQSDLQTLARAAR
jgi:hypothetical protein